MSTLRATVRSTTRHTQILATHHGDDVLRALLPHSPLHHHALPTLLEGLALWCGQPIRAALVTEDHWGDSHVADLFPGLLWPPERSNVRFEVLLPRRPRRLRGPGDFTRLYRFHRCET